MEIKRLKKFVRCAWKAAGGVSADRMPEYRRRLTDWGIRYFLCRNGFPIVSVSTEIFDPVWDKIAEKTTDSSDWTRPEAIGWLYQIATQANKTVRRQGAGSSGNTVSATGLYTPDWIAAYLLCETLDRELDQCRTLEEVEAVTLIDPACGTGHILLPAYDRFAVAYKRFLTLNEIPHHIFTYNLFGLDIDPDAVLLAQKLLLLHAGLGEAADIVPAVFSFSQKEKGDISLIGSLRILDKKESKKASNNPPNDAASLLTKRYCCVVTNPPYSGPKGIPPAVKQYAAKQGWTGIGNLDTLFIERAFSLAKPGGFIGMITTQGWMFLSTFARFRRRLLTETTLEQLAHFGTGAFPSLGGEVVSSAAFILKNTPPLPESRPVFYRLIEGDDETKRNNLAQKNGRFDRKTQAEFLTAPKAELFYYSTPEEEKLLSGEGRLGDMFDIKQGMATGDNQRFLRYWFEVRRGKTIILNTENPDAVYQPYAKGEGAHRWYSDLIDLIDWRENGALLYAARPKAVIRNPDYFFREALAWSFVGTGPVSARYRKRGAIFDVGASSIFTKKLPENSPLARFSETQQLLLALGFLNSSAAADLMNLLNPSVNFQVGDLVRLPLDSEKIAARSEEILAMVRDQTAIEQKRAARRESSPFFTLPAILSPEIRRNSLADSLDALVETVRNEEQTIAELTEQNDRLFDDILGIPHKDKQKKAEPFNENRIRQEGILDLFSFCAGLAFHRYDWEEFDFCKENGSLRQMRHQCFFLQTPDFAPLADAFFELLRRLFGENTLDETLSLTAEIFAWKGNLSEKIAQYSRKGFWIDHQRRFFGRPVYWRFTVPQTEIFLCFYSELISPELLEQAADELDRTTKKAASITKRLRVFCQHPDWFQNPDLRILKEQLAQFFLS